MALRWLLLMLLCAMCCLERWVLCGLPGETSVRGGQRNMVLGKGEEQKVSLTCLDDQFAVDECLCLSRVEKSLWKASCAGCVRESRRFRGSQLHFIGSSHLYRLSVSLFNLP